AAGRLELGDLLEEIVVDVEEERQARREAVDVETPGQRRLHVAQAAGPGEGPPLPPRPSGLTDVIAGNRDGIETRNMLRGEFDHVGDDSNRRLRRTDPFLLSDELLQKN